MTDKEKIHKEVEKIARSINPYIPDEEGKNSEYEAGRFAMATQIMQIIDSLQEKPISKELEKAAVEAFKKIVDSDKNNFLEIFKAGAEWKKANLWKDAKGDDLPEIDREVIALTQPYQDDDEHLKVVCAHRPSKYAKIWNSDLGEEQVIEVECYDKGGWNIPDVKYWLDAVLPNMED
jgi:hypothetical protein